MQDELKRTQINRLACFRETRPRYQCLRTRVGGDEVEVGCEAGSLNDGGGGVLDDGRQGSLSSFQ